MCRPAPLLEEERIEYQVFAPVFSGVEPDRKPVAAHQIHLVAFLSLCVSQRVARGVGHHPEPCRIRISNYFCIGTYQRNSGGSYASWTLSYASLSRRSLSAAKRCSSATRSPSTLCSDQH